MVPRHVLILGSGGREHALAWRLARDPAAPEVTVAPGNAGVARVFPCVALNAEDPGAVAAECARRLVDLVVVGPEGPLAAGVVDALVARGIAVFGPTRDAARLESSKWFAKTILAEAGVPTARAVVTVDAASAAAMLSTAKSPWVLKADGLAAGKGVCVTSDRAAAAAFLAGCFDGSRFGASGRRVVFEEYLEGEEVSVMAVCDGEHFLLLPAARDFKRALDGDRGTNTGGMGALAPLPVVSAELEEKIGERVVAPVLRRMREGGTPFRGILYCGLMLTAAGPRVIEFNARFGDPETQAVLPLIGGSLAVLLAGAARGRLESGTIHRCTGAAVAIALADERYPEDSSEGALIEGLDGCEAMEGVQVFHAAGIPAHGGWRVTGGRAAYVTATGADLSVAASRARTAVGRLGGHHWRYRRDVASVAEQLAWEAAAGGPMAANFADAPATAQAVTGGEL